MTETLNGIIASIKDQTGITVEILNVLNAPVKAVTSEVFLDKAAKKTYFPIKLKHEALIGVISGADTASRNYALLINKLIENAINGLTVGKQDKSDELIRMLAGEIPESRITTIKTKYKLNGSYYVLSVLPLSKSDEVKAYLSELLGETDILVKMPDKSIAFLKSCNNGDDYGSPSELGLMLGSNIKAELGIDTYIGIGGIADTLEKCPEVFSHCLEAVRIGRAIDSKSYVYNYKDYLIVRLLEKLPKETLIDYVNASVGRTAFEVFADAELMDTATQFMHNSLNISETSRILFMHRNTLIYRLDKIEKQTGLNIRRFSDAVTFRCLSIIYRLLS